MPGYYVVHNGTFSILGLYDRIPIVFWIENFIYAIRNTSIYNNTLVVVFQIETGSKLDVNVA